MTFNLAEFIKDNVTNGFSNGSFTQEQINIFALNYLTKGQISQTDFDYIQEYMTPKVEDITE